MPDIRDRLIRNVSEPIEAYPAPRLDEPNEFPNAHRRFGRPRIPNAAGLDEQLVNAWTSVDAIADAIRKRVDEIWASEPDSPVVLSPAQKHEWKRQMVQAAVEAELSARTKPLRPIIDRHKGELIQRREALTAKGSPRLTGIATERAMRIVDHLARLSPEIRTLKVSEALNNAKDPDARELLQSLVWAGPNFDLVPADSLGRVKATLAVTSDEAGYAEITQVDQAVQAVEEGLSALENWASALPNELG